MIAAVAPAAPEAGLAVAGLLLVIAFVVALGLQNLHRATLGAFLNWLGSLGIHIGIPHLPDVTVHPFGFAKRINRNIERALDWAVVNSERGMVWVFSEMWTLLKNMSHTTAQVAHDAWQGIRGSAHTTRVTVTKVVRETIVRPVAHAGKVTAAITRGQFRSLTHRVDALAARVDHMAHATAGTIARPFPRIGQLERTLERQGARIKKLEKGIAAGVAAGFAVAVLAKAVIGWLRCPSLAKNLRNRHCIDSDLLDALLTGTLLIVGTISLVEFAKEVGAVTEEANDLIHGFLRDA